MVVVQEQEGERESRRGRGVYIMSVAEGLRRDNVGRELGRL